MNIKTRIKKLETAFDAEFLAMSAFERINFVWSELKINPNEEKNYPHSIAALRSLSPDEMRIIEAKGLTGLPFERHEELRRAFEMDGFCTDRKGN